MNVDVAGGATPEEVAAIVAALAQLEAAAREAAPESRYEQWRRRRLEALRIGPSAERPAG